MNTKAFTRTIWADSPLIKPTTLYTKNQLTIKIVIKVAERSFSYTKSSSMFLCSYVLTGAIIGLLSMIIIIS